MLIDQARDLLSETFTAEIRRAFIWTVEHHGPGVRDRYARQIAKTPPRNPGHNPLAVPEVPAATINIRRRPRENASITFTYKVEYGQPPYPILNVRPDWLIQVVRRDHVVLDGFPVLDVLDRDSHGRPATIRAAVVTGYFDSTMHGWRAWAYTHEAAVDWDGDTPTIVLGDQV